MPPQVALSDHEGGKPGGAVQPDARVLNWMGAEYT
jgi:hypothetical protein